MSKCVVIAEAGINHNGSLRIAREMAYAAKSVGADIVKYQTFITSKLLRNDAKGFYALKQCELSKQDWKHLARHCEDIGIEFLTTPGELDSLKFAVEELGVKRIKIGSDDLTYTPLIKAANETGLPLILSTGMATAAEIGQAIYGVDRLSLMHCVSLYPCRSDQANLRSIPYLIETFSCPVGYSDHTARKNVVLAAVAAGASLIEAHFKVEKERVIDEEVSFPIEQLRDLIYEIRELELTLGTYGKKPTSLEREMAPQLRKGADGLRGQIP